MEEVRDQLREWVSHLSNHFFLGQLNEENWDDYVVDLVSSIHSHDFCSDLKCSFMDKSHFHKAHEEDSIQLMPHHLQLFLSRMIGKPIAASFHNVLHFFSQ